MKRLAESVLVIATAPLWLALAALVALAVRLFDGKPVMFSQLRTGLGGRFFRLWKFRTMKDGDGPDLERTTRLGRFLRSTSLDELPQLLQILTGEMALVGPRPLPVRYIPRYTSFQARRHEVRPGITGWAQINGRNAISWEKKFDLDVWYVDHRSLFLDVKILLLTLLRVFMRSGVNASADETMGEFLGQPIAPSARI